MSTSQRLTAADSRRGSLVLLGLALLFVHPVLFIIVRVAIGELRFDGVSLISLAVMLYGASLLRRHANKDAE